MVDYARRLVQDLGGPPEFADGWSHQLNDMYSDYINRNGRERPALPPIRSRPLDWRVFHNPDTLRYKGDW